MNFFQSFFRSFNFCFAFLLSIPLLVRNFCSYILTTILSISAKKHHSSVITSNQVTAPSMDATSNHLTTPTCSSFILATSNLSTSSSSPPSRWDVFLSFYGKDTRASFVAHLYEALDQAGIQTFRDDPALEKGDEISPALFKAISSSNKFVVVLSENYAYSPWCLDELAEILFCKRTKNQVVVIPVFYYVNPTDVRYQKQSFEKAIDYHYDKKRYSDDTIAKWKSALAEIGDLSGYHLRKDTNVNESDTIQEIVENVAPQASTKVLHLEECLLRIDSAVEEIYQKLNMESNDVRAIGICGMGGIGKTTTAKAFFNKYSNKFDISCFIENVKQQYSQGRTPLLSLLEQLLIELLRKKDYKIPNLESGIKELQQILPFKKAFIVLDDLDQLELLIKLCKLFSPGSRIIITTRDANLLNQLKVDISKVDIYMVKELGETDSLELFTYHAFGISMPPDSFNELSLKFVTYAGGLPLALKVLGSSLRGRTDVSFWKAKLEKVQEIPENKIQKILQLSYDELDDESEKAIFLDIVFFFVGKDKDEAAHVFKSCHFYPDVGIPILVERCLLTIDDHYKFQMHNLIQDMGREIIREESKHGKCRRLYLCHENAWDALQNLEGTDKIEALILDLTTWTTRHLGVKLFERMPNLRLLEIIGAHNIKDYEGNFKNSFHNLRCMRWPHCPLTYLPSDFRPQQLVFLDMPYSKLKTMWKNTMPIGQLTELGHLDLRGCVNMTRLPKSFKQWTNLGYLNMSDCRNLKRLPEQLGDMKGLKMLDASDTSIEQLPDSIGRLKELVQLHLFGCKKLTSLPNSIRKLKLLEQLDLEECSNLERLPEQLGKMQSLEFLDASCTAIEEIPDSIVLLSRLQHLNLHGCRKLKKLPGQLGKMQCLEMLDASRTSIDGLPDSIVLPRRLWTLNLEDCEKLLYLPNSIWNLSDATSIRLPRGDICRINIPDTVTMIKLKILNMRCNIRLWLPIILSFSSLERLSLTDEGESFSSTKPFSLSKLTNLRDLTLDNCTSLGSSFPELPLNLEFLSVSDYATLEQLPDLSSFKQLNQLYISNCISLQSLPPLPPHLQLNNCTSLGSSFPELPLNLVFLSVSDYATLEQLPDLSSFKQLKYLKIINCISLQSLPSLPPHLVTLEVYDCTSLQHVPDLSRLNELKRLSFSKVGGNREIPEWLSYKSSGCTISFKIPPIVGDYFWGFALWLLYKCKSSTDRRGQYIRAVIKNKTEGITNNYEIDHPTRSNTGEAVQSRIEYISGDEISVKSGDIIKISFQTSLYYHYRDDVADGELQVEKCGAHVLQSTPY